MPTLWQCLGMHWSGGEYVKGQGHGYENRHGHMAASKMYCCGRDKNYVKLAMIVSNCAFHL